MQKESKSTAFQAVIAGGASGSFTRAVAQPLDVLKIRFQLQLEPIQSGSKYSSMLQAVAAIVKEEGITTLWSGHVPAQLLSISYGILQFTVFEKLSALCENTDDKFYMKNKNWMNFANGAVAATVATVGSFPFDTVRTRLIAEQKTNKAYKGFMHATSMMIKTEGITALFKGLAPTLAQIAPHAGIQFAVYKLFTDNILPKIVYFRRSDKVQSVAYPSSVRSSLLGNLIAGSIAGFVAKGVIYPFDLVKKRLQIQGFQHYRVNFGRQMYCDSVLHCLRLTISEEGLLALYKGLGPSMMKAVIVSALHFAVYDEMKDYLLKIQR